MQGGLVWSMAQNTIKLNNVNKDFNMKGKDVLVALEECGIQKKTGGTLEPVEFEIFIEYLTKKNEIRNLDDYLDGKATIVSDRPKVKKEEPKPEAKAETPAAEEKKLETAKPETAKPETAKPEAAKPEAKKPEAAKPAEKKPAEKKPEVAKVATSEAKKPEVAAEKPAEKKPEAQRPGVPGLHLRPVDKPKTLPQNQSGLHLRPVDKPKTPVAGAQGKPVSGQSQQTTARPVTAAKPQPQKPVQPQKKQEKKPQKKAEKQALRTILPLSGAAIPEGSGETVVAKTPKTRVVDTRTTDVDLSKYDDRLDHFTQGMGDFGGGKQKLKKQDNRNQNAKSQKEKDRLAQEKIKRMEAEKARQKQLEITLPDEITVGELASRLKKTSAEVIKKLILMGVMANVNQTVDYDTAYIVADEFGAKVTKEVVVTIEEKLFDEAEDASEDLEERSPVICVMGHVDHGKTSLLDAIRHTNVTKGEAGGITQAIGAYRVNCNGKDLTFLDTPGHEAFTAMRARGAKSTDIAILVVAADDGIMPQTVEAINHARAAGIEIIVAINKMDKPHANPDMVKQSLTQHDLVPEEWGGDVICVPVSALTGMGIDDLLESVLMVAELKELRANPNRRAKGLVIESRLDRGRGPVATLLVQNGTLNTGDIVIAGTAVGRVRAMTDHFGKPVKKAGPSVPVEIIGLDAVPAAGDEFNAVVDEKMARSLAEQRREEARQAALGGAAKASLDDLFAQVNDGYKKLDIVVKADVDGSVEAVKAALLKLSNEEVKVSVIHAAVGGITESDVMLAAASNAIIIGFSVRPDKNALDSADRQKVEIRTYRVIYECIEEIEAAMKGMLAPTYKESLLGHAVVRQAIRVPNVGVIAGSYVQDGKITRNAQIRVVRDGIVLCEDKIASLRRFKDDVKEVAQGYECGIGLEKLDKADDIREGDILEAFEMVEVER